MADFHRPEYILEALEGVSPLVNPSNPYGSRSRSGIVSKRSATSAGWAWTEEYGPLFVNRADVQSWLAFLDWSWRYGGEFEILHVMTPGSGLTKNGTTSNTPTISGAGQTGSVINMAGFENSQARVMAAGDLIRIAGINRTFRVVHDADSNASGVAAVTLDPPMFGGLSPANAAAVTTNGVKMFATLGSRPNLPESSNYMYYSGINLSFVEVTDES